MEWNLGKWVLLWAIVLLQIHQHRCCFEDERMSLLGFKASLKSPGFNVDHLLPSWVDEKESTDCCGWERVTCNTTSSHVIHLSLANLRKFDFSEYYEYDLILLLNFSFFYHFKELQSLDLSSNWFGGLVVNEGFERLSDLRKLEFLDLSFNQFNDSSIIQSLGALTSLKTLILSDNYFGRYFPINESVAFRNLQKLDLKNNGFKGFLLPVQDFGRLSILKKLETLILDYNAFNNSILPYLSELTSLKILSLQGNSLEGSFPAQELATLENLEMLDVGYNKLNGTLTTQDLESLSRLKKLKTLDLTQNQFNKSIIQSLSALPSLKTLTLAVNQFEGSFPAQELSNLKNLESLDVSRNGLNGSLTMQDSKSLSKLSNLKHLDLSYNRFDKQILKFLGSLPALESLFLVNNEMRGSLSNQDSKSLSKLSNLKHLNLSENGFNKEILKFLGSLPVLKSLRLAKNEMEGSLSNQELANLSSSLEVLILDNNNLNGGLPIQDLVIFNSLEVLDLSNNNFSGSIPPFIGALSSLKALSLGQNKLNGSLPNIQGLCKLKKLEELYLSQNNFDGILPSCLSNLTSLRMLDLSQNNFTGSISSSLISALKSLEYIDLSHNRFNGLFSFSSFANHTKLEAVKFINDKEEFEVETEFSDWVPMFQLKVLVLRNCNMNDIPNFLLNQYELRAVDLSNNHLKGRFPNWLLENCKGLYFLNLRSNSFTGQLYLPLYPNMCLFTLDVSDNQIGGQLPENIGERVPHIMRLNISGNAFEGAIPTSICDMALLEMLDFSNNRLSGEVPTQLIAGYIDGLSVLKLSNNSFHGQIFSEHFNLTGILQLYLDNNHFTGTLSNVISRCSNLVLLDIGNNYMSGEIQSGIGNLTGLSTLIMRNNSFRGLFPCELLPFSYLDLSHNHFSGSVSRCSNLQYLEHIHLRDNKFTGSLPKAFLNSSTLLTLDIGDNFLSGNISDSIGGLSNLRVLLLRGNHLSGLIPYQMCQLKKIGLMDLSHNSLSGSVPHCFNNITFWKTGISEHVFTPKYDSWHTRASFYDYTCDLLGLVINMWEIVESDEEQDEVEFVTKYISLTYKGDNLNYMSGLDLSCNNLTGEIPHELGKLTLIHALNLSHNQLTGSIPSAFSNLNQIESMDLSYNNLSGEIPSELIYLHFLEVFSVAHNNLSGRVPDMKGQFGTFEKSSYDGNPFLCRPPLEKNCTTFVESPQSSIFSSDESKRKWYEIDPVAFYASFGASYAVFLLGVASVLYINLYWRRWWFNLVEECFYSCCYFIYDAFYNFLACFHN